MPHTPYKDESDSEEEEEEIAAVEMILETYFMHCDNTYNKLQTLCEHRLPLQLSQDAGLPVRHRTCKSVRQRSMA